MISSAEPNVTQAAAAAWVAHGVTPVALTVPPAWYEEADEHVLPMGLLGMYSHGCIEAYFGEDQSDLGSARNFVLSLANRGMQVTAVVPLCRLGVAHEEFREAGVLLQAWWRDAEGVVRFSASERA